tara:strand:+ start:152 stop:484 length:333 start_codon:yes stop_codon:yes gene_type:complete
MSDSQLTLNRKEKNMKLNNGKEPVSWSVWRGGEGEHPYMGAVLAHRDHPMHPWIAWDCNSKDGINFDCYHGDYCSTFEMAFAAYHRKRLVAKSYHMGDRFAALMEEQFNG